LILICFSLDGRILTQFIFIGWSFFLWG
jgi:hypothetical protein